MPWSGELASPYVNVAAILLEMFLFKTPMSYTLDLFQEGASEKTEVALPSVEVFSRLNCNPILFALGHSERTLG